MGFVCEKYAFDLDCSCVHPRFDVDFFDVAEETVGDKNPIKENLAEWYVGDNTFNEFPWFNSFPEDVKMANIVELYKMLLSLSAIN